MKDDSTVFKMLTPKLKGKRPVGKPRSRWKKNVKRGLKEIGVIKRNWVDTNQKSINGEPL